MHRILFIALSSVAVAVPACTALDDGAGAGAGDPGGGKADDAGARITFAEDFTETLEGRLVGGGSVRVSYDLDRLQDCRGSTGGSEVWGVSGYVRYDDGEAESFAVSELRAGRVVPVEARLEIPADTQVLAMWFAINNRWGCIAYDSNFGADYDFDVSSGGASVVLDFAADYTVTQTGPIGGGDRVVIHYEPSRLAECAGSSGGHAQWAVTGYWSFDGGAARSTLVTTADGADLVPSDPELVVPPGTRDLALWFEATNRWGCHAWDSNFGDNYHVAIE